jgi:hypothetical protein
MNLAIAGLSRMAWIGSLEVHDFELDVLGAVVFPCLPEGNWQDH